MKAVILPLVKSAPLLPDELQKIHAYWRAANYLSVGQIYLLDNPLLRLMARIFPRQTDANDPIYT